jgi:hypothetical protein
MENQTSFDLNAAIQGWRAELGKSSSFQKDDLDELESHVRDSAEALRGQGLTGEEAFLIAIRRTGKQEHLAAEFATINGASVWLERIVWMTVGWIGIPALISVATWPLLGGIRQLPSVMLQSEMVPFAILALLLIVGMRSALPRRQFSEVLALAAGFLFVTLVTSRAFPFMNPAIPPVALALALIIALRFTRLRKPLKVTLGLAGCVLLLTLLGLLLATDAAIGEFNYRSIFYNINFFAQCMVGASLILVALKRLRASPASIQSD